MTSDSQRLMTVYWIDADGQDTLDMGEWDAEGDIDAAEQEIWHDLLKQCETVDEQDCILAGKLAWQ